MREHHALGKPRGAGGVLHVDDVVAADGGARRVEQRVGLVVAEQHQFRRRVEPTVLFLADVADVFEVRIGPAAQVAAGVLLQLGHEPVDDLEVIDVAKAVDEPQHLHVGLLEDVVEFLGLVGGVDGDEHGAGLGAGELEHQPVGHVLGPDAHVVALADADGEQALRQAIDALVELPVGPAQAAVGIDEEVVVRRFPGPEFELLPERQRGEAVGARADGGVGGGGREIRHLEFRICDWRFGDVRRARRRRRGSALRRRGRGRGGARRTRSRCCRRRRAGRRPCRSGFRCGRTGRR